MYTPNPIMSTQNLVPSNELPTTLVPSPDTLGTRKELPGSQLVCPIPRHEVQGPGAQVFGCRLCHFDPPGQGGGGGGGRRSLKPDGCDILAHARHFEMTPLLTK